LRKLPGGARHRVLRHNARNGAQPAPPWCRRITFSDGKPAEIQMDIVFLLLTAALSAVTIGLVYGLERLRRSR
jgi:hypothetical protein